MTSNPEEIIPSQDPVADEATEVKGEIAPPEPSFGWNSYAEVLNGRFAMVGIVVVFAIELITHKDIFTWIGLR